MIFFKSLFSKYTIAARAFVLNDRLVFFYYRRTSHLSLKYQKYCLSKSEKSTFFRRPWRPLKSIYHSQCEKKIISKHHRFPSDTLQVLFSLYGNKPCFQLAYQLKWKSWKSQTVALFYWLRDVRSQFRSGFQARDQNLPRLNFSPQLKITVGPVGKCCESAKQFFASIFQFHGMKSTRHQCTSIKDSETVCERCLPLKGKVQSSGTKFVVYEALQIPSFWWWAHHFIFFLVSVSVDYNSRIIYFIEYC